MKNFVLGALLGIGLSFFFAIFLEAPVIDGTNSAKIDTPRAQVLTYSQFVAELEAGKIERVTFYGSKIFGSLKDRSRFETFVPHAKLALALTDRLLAKKVIVAARPGPDIPSVASILASWIPTLLSYVLFFGGLWFIMTRPILALIRRLDAIVQLARPPELKPPD